MYYFDIPLLWVPNLRVCPSELMNYFKLEGKNVHIFMYMYVYIFLRTISTSCGSVLIVDLSSRPYYPPTPTIISVVSDPCRFLWWPSTTLTSTICTCRMSRDCITITHWLNLWLKLELYNPFWALPL